MFAQETHLYATNQARINIPATFVMLTTLCRVVECINADLNEIAKSVQDLSFPAVRKFIVEYMMLDVGELYLYSAFRAPSDELFYLP